MGKIRWKIDTVIVVAVFGIAMAITMCINFNKKKDLQSNSNVATGIITSIWTLGNVDYIDYSFNVDGECYNSSAHYSPYKNKFVVGDTIIVVYQRNKPQNCEVMQER